jgi:hypothetical protein
MGLVASTATGACSATGRGSDFDGEGGNGSTQSGNPSGGGMDGVGGLFGANASVGVGTGPAPDSGCAATQSKAEQVPLDMYIMLDKSGSMDEAAGNTTKWKATKAALKAFVEQPSAAGIGVGIQYFGLPPGGGACGTFCATDADCGGCGPCMPFFPSGICAGAGGDSCNAADYAKPEVEIAPLPGIAPSIIASMNSHSPTTGTPTSAALQGAVDHAKDWATQHVDHVVVAVLATDGNPSGCDENLNNINAIAAAGANGVPKILTFVIGVGNSSAALNGIAQAGGTNQAFFVDANQNATDEFLKAMNEIRGAALACSYLIPEPEMGDLDFGNVNVQYQPSGGGEPVIIPKVGSKAECPASGFAWFYDNNAEPKQIVMCDATCETIKMDTDGEVSILIGCATVVN